MKIIEILQRMFMVRYCLGCLEPISYDKSLPFCEECELLWEQIKSTKCRKCGQEIGYCFCTPSNLRKLPCSLTAISVFYNPKSENCVNEIIFTLKRKGFRTVVDFITDQMEHSLKRLFAINNLTINEYTITYITRKKNGILKYGFDHTELLAKSLSKKLGIKYEKVFDNHGKHEQKTLTKTERLENASASYKVRKSINIKDKKYILIDDVITSGATLRVCAEMLYSYGAKNVVFAAYAKDNFLNGGKNNVKRNTGNNFTRTVKSSF